MSNKEYTSIIFNMTLLLQYTAEQRRHKTWTGQRQRVQDKQSDCTDMYSSDVGVIYRAVFYELVAKE